MKVISSDEEVLKKVTFSYSGVTSLYVSCFIYGLLRSDTYLLLGSRKILPLFLLLVVLEVFKWGLQVIIYKQGALTANKIFLLLGKSINWTDILRSLLIIFICCVGYNIIAVLFGAALFSQHEETIMFSVLLTLLTGVPLSVQFGSVYIENFILRIRPDNAFNALVFYNCQGALMGAWFGAFVIPLDWDRPWQIWPIPCSLGALIGYCLSNYLYLILMTAINLGILKKKLVYVLHNIFILTS